jgi:predicted regulator of Ras-like GTPase activity (Roadblock/LC7/MglB family)
VTASPQQIRQWTDELAADPASLAFLPLAGAYRALGKRDAALRLVLRGLERHPHHVDAHHLLGLLYLDGGDRVKAEDEFGMALALSPEHPESRREMGLCAFARGDWAAAVRHLEQAQAHDVTDDEVRAALETAWAHTRGAAPAAPAPARAAAPAPEAWDGGRAFDVLAAEFGALRQERGIVGAVMLDAQGFVVAGEMQAGGTDRAAEVAAVLSGASSEAERAIRHLQMGAWKGILVETPQAAVRLSPTSDGGMVAVSARREVPMGWVLRVAGRARDAAERFVAAVAGGTR